MLTEKLCQAVIDTSLEVCRLKALISGMDRFDNADLASALRQLDTAEHRRDAAARELYAASSA